MATQSGRRMAMTTPLDGDKLLIQALRGEEAVSALFNFTVDAIAKVDDVVEFEKLLGEGVTVKLFADAAGTVARHFHGHVRCITQGESDSKHTRYSLEIVPKVWMLTKKSQSRIFQQITVIDILKKVLTGFDINVDADASRLEPRDYCVQYRETDWNFASRLMEEEGFYYYFEFADGSHKLVITSHGKAKNVPFNANITYKNVQHGGAQNESFIYKFSKSQEMTAGKVLLWDHCFEDPPKRYESPENVPATAALGQVTHKLNVNNSTLESYDYPGEFAQRFDGVSPGGGDRAADIAKIQPDGARTVKIRMQSEAATAVWADGASTVGQLTPGHKFTLATQASDELTKHLKAPGDYMILSVTHTARMQDSFQSGGTTPFIYQNTFEVVANSVAYRPPRYTYKPVVPGTQTATVVGPAGQEIFTDKYGRVKVKFHWDRKDSKDASNSCWIRVGTPWAGRNWGMFHLPRIGQEVIVDFQEGDPDQPICIGSVYNAHQMPAYTMPDNMTKSWVKSNSSMGGEGYNEIRFEDLKGKEQIYIHGERNYDMRIRNESMTIINNHTHLIVGGHDVTAKEDKKADYRERIDQDKHLHVMRHQEEHIEGSYKLMVGHGKSKEPGNLSIVLQANRMEVVGGESHLHVHKDRLTLLDAEDHYHVKGNTVATYDGEQSVHVKGSRFIDSDRGIIETCDNYYLYSKTLEAIQAAGDASHKIGGACKIEAGSDYTIKSGASIVLEAPDICLKGAGGFIRIDGGGVTIVGTLVKINSGGGAASAPGVGNNTPEGPADATDAKDAARAKPTDPTVADKSITGKKSCD